MANETYYNDYDLIEYADLLDDKGERLSESGQPLNAGAKVFTFDRKSSSYSAIFKFKWVPGIDGASIQFSFEHNGSMTNMAYPFGVYVKSPNKDGAGANGAWHLQPNVNENLINMSIPIKAFIPYNIELGRLKVSSGANIGKYYTYLKVNDELIKEGYVTVDNDGHYKSNSVDCYLGNEIYFYSAGTNNSKIMPLLSPDLYEEYNEIGYKDLLNIETAQSLPEKYYIIGTEVFNYNKKTNTDSVLLKFSWRLANERSSFQVGFDKIEGPKMPYMFGAQYYSPTAEYPNGYVWLRPGYGPKQKLTQKIMPYKDYNIELARLKITQGTDINKYYVYFKMIDNTDQIIAFVEDYVDADIIDINNNYVSNPGNVVCTISNEIFISFWGGGGNNKITSSMPSKNIIDFSSYDSGYAYTNPSAPYIGYEYKIVNSEAIIIKSWYEGTIYDNYNGNSYIPEGTIDHFLTIPSTLNGFPVTCIYNNAFQDRKGITEINLPENLLYIGEEAFKNCTTLDKVTIPSTLREIGPNAWTGCEVIKVNVTDLNTWFSLEFKEPSCNPMYSSPSHYFHYNNSILNELNIPLDLIALKDWTSPMSWYIETVNIPDSIIYIGQSVLSSCGYIHKITIPFIGQKADDMSSQFNYLFGGEYVPSGLTEVTISNSKGSIGIPNSAFADCSNIKKVTMSGISEIYPEAFARCTQLQEVNLSNNLKVIYRYAFKRCSNLTSIKIPNTVISIGERAFAESGLNSIEIHPYLEGYGTMIVNQLDIEKNAFENCESLQRVDIIGLKEWCYIGFSTNTSNPMFYADEVYIDNVLLTNLVIPDDVVKISDYAFCNCKNLINLSLPEGINKIEISAFENCSNLSNVEYLPKTITTIEENAFNGCDSLAVVNYGASEKYKNQMNIKEGNNNLLNATWIYTPSFFGFYIDKDKNKRSFSAAFYITKEGDSIVRKPISSLIKK